MTQEEKILLLKDLCARLPYGVKIHNTHPNFPNTNEYIQTLTDIHGTMQSNWITFGTDCEEINVDWSIGNKEEDVPKPYLRPMSSMTEEEYSDYQWIAYKEYDGYNNDDKPNYTGGWVVNCDMIDDMIDFLNSHHFDYRGLIEKGLALEAPEGMYNIKK